MIKNKLTYFLFLFLWISTIYSVAQEAKPYGFYEYKSLGVKIGATYSSIDLQPAIGDVISEISYTGGLVYIFSDKKYVGIQLELLYSQRKWTESFSDGSVTTDLRYIEVPLITNINLGNGKMKYIINIGTYFSYNINKQLQMGIPFENEYYQSIIDREERNFDFGLIIGGAVRYISSVGIFQLDLRYVYGFQKLYNEDATGFKYSNMSGVNLGIIYTMNLKKK